MSEIAPTSLGIYTASRVAKTGWLGVVEPAPMHWLLFILTTGYGAVSVAAGEGRGYAAFQQSTTSGHAYYPEYPTEPYELAPQPQAGYPGSQPQWPPAAGGYAAPFGGAGSNAPHQGFKFRDVPGSVPVEQPMPRFRPDSLRGQSPYSWGQQDGSWPDGTIGPPPVFRPLEKEPDQGGVARYRDNRSGGDRFLNRRQNRFQRDRYQSDGMSYRPTYGQ